MLQRVLCSESIEHLIHARTQYHPSATKLCTLIGCVGCCVTRIFCSIHCSRTALSCVSSKWQPSSLHRS